MSLRDIMEARIKSSLGPERKLLCKICLVEQMVFPMSGHKDGEMDLGCVVCGNQIARLKFNEKGEHYLDTSFYTEKKEGKNVKNN